MKNVVQNRLYRATVFLELLVGICVLLACAVCGIGMIFTTDAQTLFTSPEYFQTRLDAACYIIIGVEFIKMIASHTIDSVIDVMLLAVARQMIIEHTMPLENLLAVLAVAVLFIVRKYLYISQIDKVPGGKERPTPAFPFRRDARAEDAKETTAVNQ